jgi:hypothetical protein
VKRNDIVEHARSWLGVPWRHQGRIRLTGIDCVGLPALVGESLGIWKPIPVAYPRRPDGKLLDAFRQYLDQKPMKDAKNGDVLIFAESTHICHCGIMSTLHGQPGLIHAHAARREVIEETMDSARSMIGKPIYCFAFPGVED